MRIKTKVNSHIFSEWKWIFTAVIEKWLTGNNDRLLIVWFIVRYFSDWSKFTAFKKEKFLKFRKRHFGNGKLLQVAKICSRIEKATIISLMSYKISVICRVNDGDKYTPTHSLKVCICIKIGNVHYLANGRPWKCCRGKCVHFTIEIWAIVKIYDRNNERFRI